MRRSFLDPPPPPAECENACASERAIAETCEDQRFTTADRRRCHRDWPGEMYEWAGEYRRVNLTKGDFMFAAAEQAPGRVDESHRSRASHGVRVRRPNDFDGKALCGHHAALR